MTALVFTLLTLGCTAAPRQLEIATTTSVVNSGLLDYVLGALPGDQPRIHAAGSGRSLAMLANGTVDLVITHAPEAEARALEAHRDWSYQKLAYNHFLIVGPESDRAAVGSAPTAVEAFRRIAAHDAAFVSRGDESGTHEREMALWRAAGVDRSSERILISGGSMATTLRQADQQQAYTLSDDGTWQQLKGGMKLTVLNANASELVNTYAVIYDSGSPDAARFAEWLTTGEGRDRIASYRIAGHPPYTIWPSGCPGATPAALPDCGTERTHGEPRR